MKRPFLPLIVTVVIFAASTSVADAAPRRKKPLPKKPGYENPLDKKAYGRTQAFVDTDFDGRKFDLHQPPRVRHAPTINPNDRKKKKKG